MKIDIDISTTTQDLKTPFMDSFDGIKIEFFKHSHEHEQGSPKKDMVQGNVQLNELNPKLTEQHFSIDENMTVNQVEDIFEERLGLHIQVFRKMNLSWIETTATDSYTLKEQVQLSRESRGLSN
ncbi:MAG: hypothetical protein JXR19_05855 [Bacteroidia bacterium]